MKIFKNILQKNKSGYNLITFIFFIKFNMNKKIVLSVLLSSVLLLASCGKPLWTFEDEIKAEQLSYSNNLDSFFKKTEDFYQWKFSTKWEVKLDVSWEMGNGDETKGSFKIPFSSKSILEKDNFAFDTDLGLNLWIELKKWKDSNIWEWELKANLETKLALLDGVLYSSLKKISAEPNFKGKNSEKYTEYLKEIVKKSEEYLWKIYSIDFNKIEGIDEIVEEYKKSYKFQFQLMQMYREGLKSFLTWDVFSKAEKVTHNWKEAYKFTFDYKKLTSHSVQVIKTLYEKYPEPMDFIFKSKEEFEIIVASMQEQSENEQLAKIASENFPEMYLTRASDGGANLEIVSKDNFLKIEILESQLKITAIENQKEVFKIVFSASLSGKISFKIEEINSKLKLNWDFLLNRKWDSLEQNFNLELWLKDEKNPLLKDFNFDLKLQSETKKDDSVTITKESIVEDKEVIVLSEILEQYIKMYAQVYKRILEWDYNSLGHM